jgi:hypothetical protein
MRAIYSALDAASGPYPNAAGQTCAEFTYV